MIALNGFVPTLFLGEPSTHILQMDQQPYPGPSPLFHLRMTSLFVILWVTDFIMFVVAIDHTITYGVGGMVLFASEVTFLLMESGTAY